MGKLELNTLTSTDRTALEQCDFTREVIGVKKNKDGSKTIVQVSRDHLNCWQLFLKVLGLGKLARTEFRLTEVAKHLDQYKWMPLDTTNPAYAKVCEIANKALLKGALMLYKNVSVARDIRLEMHMGKKEGLVLQQIHYNPALKAKHLVALAKNRCRYEAIASVETNPSIETNDRLLLEKERDLTIDDIPKVHLRLDLSTKYTDFPIGWERV